MPADQLKTVLFICTGNFYRSRFAEYLFNALAAQCGLPWRAVSRGLKTWAVEARAGTMSEFAAYRLTSLGVPFNAQRCPIQLTEADLKSADRIVALKQSEHRKMMLEQFPRWAGMIEYWQVDDLDCATADEALPRCEACVRFLVKTLLTEQKRRETPTLRRDFHTPLRRAA